MKLLAPLALCAALAAPSCGQRLELIEDTYSLSGQLRYRGLAQSQDGALLAQAEWVFWHPNGRMLARGSFRDAPLGGRTLAMTVPERGREGAWTFWGEDGQILAQGAYRDGLRSGRWTCWYPDGRRCWEGSFRAGLPEGHHVRFHPGGRKAQELTYLAGQLHGERRVWDELGQLVWSGLYERGLPQRGGPGDPPPLEPIHCEPDLDLELLSASRRP